MDVKERAGHMQLMLSTVLTGSAKEGISAPSVGLLDIGVSEAAYIFRVAMPGARKDQCNVRCEIGCDGKVNVHGEIPTNGGVLRRSPNVYEMNVLQIGAPGPFCVSFSLPGPVDPRLASPTFRADGILEVIVLKLRAPGFQVDGRLEQP